MKKRSDEQVTEGQAGLEIAETTAINTEMETAGTSETDELRAYAPASAAMAPATPEDDEDYYEGEDYEGEYEDESSEIEDEPKSEADILREYVNQDFVDQTVKTINSMYRKDVDNGKVEIGTYVLEEVFKGKIEDAMSTNPKKHETFSQIIKRTDLLVEPKTLASWVRAAAVKKSFQKKGINCPNLTTYHYVELATVRNEEKRIQFARQAEAEKLTVKDLREVIRKAKGNSKSDLEGLMANMGKSIRQFKDVTEDEKLKKFASDVASVKEAYPPEKAVTLLPDVKKCLSNARKQERLFKEFHASLRSIVEEAMEPESE